MKGTTSGKPLHVMVDIETLDTKPTACILSVAAVPFDLRSITGVFPYWTWYKKIDTLSQKAPFTKSADTIAWWQKQDKAVMMEVFSATEQMGEVLGNLRSTLHNAKEAVGATRLEMWSFGGNFDIPILEHAYAVCGIAVPWSYKYIRCFRTLKALFPEVDEEPQSAGKHNALDDALVQAKHAGRIMEYMRMKGMQYG